MTLKESTMKNNLWIFFAIISGFTGFLLGYSIPPMIEVGFSATAGEVDDTEPQKSSEDEDLDDYYEQLQELQN